MKSWTLSLRLSSLQPSMFFSSAATSVPLPFATEPVLQLLGLLLQSARVDVLPPLPPLLPPLLLPPQPASASPMTAAPTTAALNRLSVNLKSSSSIRVGHNIEASWRGREHPTPDRARIVIVLLPTS